MKFSERFQDDGLHFDEESPETVNCKLNKNREKKILCEKFHQKICQKCVGQKLMDRLFIEWNTLIGTSSSNDLLNWCLLEFYTTIDKRILMDCD